MSGDVTAAIDEARAYVARWDGWPDSNARLFRTLLAEVERLRAEREALHSDETRRRIADAIANARFSDGWKTSDELSHAVMPVLAADPEADQ